MNEITEKVDRQIIKMWQIGYGVKDIAEKLGIPDMYVRKRLARYLRRTQDMTMYEIAKIVEVSPETVRYWLKPSVREEHIELGKTWRERHKAELAAKFRERYRTDEEFRKRHLERVKKRQKEMRRLLRELEKKSIT